MRSAASRIMESSSTVEVCFICLSIAGRFASRIVRIITHLAAMQKRASARPLVIARHLAVSTENIFVCRKPVQSYRATSVQPARADPDLSAEPVTIAVCKTGRGIMEDACGIHLLQKCVGRIEIIRDDGVGMSGAETLNVVYGFVDVVNDFQGQNEIAVFCVPFV